MDMKKRSVVMQTQLLIFCILLPLSPVSAEETDFSCVQQQVRAKTMVTERLQEFDVILKNDCPGSVNWTLCIERMNPFTNRVTETLTPSGQLEKDKQFRINLQMKKMEDQQNKLSGYEEFYVNATFAIDTVEPPRCVARQCESDKKSVRDKIRANERARQKAEAEMNRKMDSECPQSGWSDAQQEKCMTRIQKEAKDKLDSYAETDRALRMELAEIAPDLCEIHSVE